MREVQFCQTCNFRLPYCVRTDRRFCGQRCRVWWYWHPGQKRLDFSPGSWGMPSPPRRGQPKTLAAALTALAESRKYAAKLTAAARTMQLVDCKLRATLAEVRAEAITSRRELCKELEALRDELEETQARLAEANLSGTNAAPEAPTLEQKEKELAELRIAQEQEVARYEEEIRALKSQAASTAAVCDHFSRQNAELARGREALRSRSEELSGQLGRAEAQAAALRATVARIEAEVTVHRNRAENAERTWAARDEELTQRRRNLAAAEHAHREAHHIAESESRSLLAEKERRIAAENRIEQLTMSLEALSQGAPLSTSPGYPPLSGSALDILRAENQDVRSQRDAIDAERELLVARMLKWMAPGQYLEHAAASGYDITQDPLIRIKRTEILVDHRYYAWQEQNGLSRKARELDANQTVIEQAYAAAFAARWALVHKKHRRIKHDLRWLVVGFMLDEQSEDYLLKLAQKRIERMEQQMRETGPSR